MPVLNGSEQDREDGTLTETDRAWIESTLESLTLRKKIGQLLCPFLTDETAKTMSMPEMVAEYGLGGGHVPRGDIPHYRDIIRQAQEAADIPLFITADMESGAGCTITGCTTFPFMMAYGGMDDEELAYEFGRITALEARAVGVNWNFGPVIDVIANPQYYRTCQSISGDPKQVARLSAAMIRGMQDHGLIACAKHFPGDGHNENDQHLTTPVLDLSRDEWMATCITPFMKVIEEGVYSIMNGHIAVPCVDDVKSCGACPLPASLSRKLTTGVLREELGYDGVIITDAMTMGGARIHYPRTELYGRALQAGNDVLLYIRDVDETVDTIERMVEEGEIPEQQVDDSVRRVLAMKAKIGLHNGGTLPSDDEMERIVARPDFTDSARKTAAGAVTLVTDTQNKIPLGLKAGAKVASVTLTWIDALELNTFDDALRNAGYDVTSFRQTNNEAFYTDVKDGVYDAVIMNLLFPYNWGVNTARAAGPAIRPLVAGAAFARDDIERVFISWANPFHNREFAYMDPYLVTFGYHEEAQIAAARALTGKIPVTGRIPYRLPGFYEAGHGIRRS